MRALQHAWEDIKRGENVDLYVTVIVSMVLAALNIAGIAPQAWMTPLNLAVLALLAVATLGNRHRLEGLLQQMAQTAESVLLEAFPDDVYSSLGKAKELWLVGVDLANTLDKLYSAFEDKLREGDSIRVLVVNPDGQACAMAARRNYALTDVERQRTRIRATLKDFCELQKVAPDRLEIRTIEYPLAFGVYAMDPGEDSGVLSLKHYPFKMPVVQARPGLVLQRRDQPWYNQFWLEICQLWETAAPWPCQSLVDGQRSIENSAGEHPPP